MAEPLDNKKFTFNAIHEPVFLKSQIFVKIYIKPLVVGFFVKL